MGLTSFFKKINHVVDEDLGKLPEDVVPAKVTIKLESGETYTEQVNSAKGTIGNPMTKRELDNKFRGLASTVIPDGQAAKIIQTVDDLEGLDNVRNLAQLLVATGDG